MAHMVQYKAWYRETAPMLCHHNLDNMPPHFFTSSSTNRHFSPEDLMCSSQLYTNFQYTNRAFRFRNPMCPPTNQSGPIICLPCGNVRHQKTENWLVMCASGRNIIASQ
ncbi:hypothetical protein CDAR_553581 [Caerostris darwini]|uniref:Uncharacterized protein n=1 Tax=Caerostris darwini TaxID=1538125 RepID=A0AAV4U9T8_9ARAC|nr:hypothetical protein CDAR_553581 [Caerostris darwini]